MTHEYRASRSGLVAATGSTNHLLALAVCLEALAGWVDATGFISFKGLFVSFMSGNTTKGAVALVHHDMAHVFVLARTSLLFVGGTIIGEVIALSSRGWRRPVILACEAACLGGAALAARFELGELVVASLLGFTMGVQNAVLHKIGDINLGLTYVTGALVQVGRGIAGVLRGVASGRDLLPFIGLWVGLTFGGVSGALVASASVVAALTSALAICAVLMAWVILQRPRFV